MTTIPMYSLRTEGHGYRITKFVDGEVESSYSVSEAECDCPAGHRHTCRHRQMLPTMLAHGIADSHWFFLHDRGGQIVDFNGTSKSLLDQLAASALPARMIEPETAHAPELVAIDADDFELKQIPAGTYSAEIGNLSDDGILSLKNVTPVGAAQHAEAEPTAWDPILPEDVGKPVRLNLPEGVQVFGMDDLLGIHNAIADAVGEPEAKIASLEEVYGTTGKLPDEAVEINPHKRSTKPAWRRI